VGKVYRARLSLGAGDEEEGRTKKAEVRRQNKEDRRLKGSAFLLLPSYFCILAGCIQPKYGS
jgi:hypothetical protein